MNKKDKVMVNNKGYGDDRAILTAGASSELISYFLGDIGKYLKILQKQKASLLRRYPNRNLSPIFATLQTKLLTVGPVALCDYLTSDLGKVCPEDILIAIGLVCLEISAHDDVVDETPGIRSKLAALVYAGNIAALEGIRILYWNDRKRIADLIISLVNQNHYLQQMRVEKLWERKPSNFIDYQDGVKDGAVLVQIGLFPALETAGRDDLRQQLTRFSESYALVLQLIDDIREVDEDKVHGYHSFPILEGAPFEKSFKAMGKHLRIAEENLRPDWRKMNSLVENLKALVAKMKSEFDGN